MYHLQLTVYEEHGDYNCHSYLWRREPDEPGQLVDSADTIERLNHAFPSEHEEILAVFASHLSTLLKDTPLGHADVLF